ncbi:MAG TPA: glycoside hydrolase family 2 protein, partial [Chitinophagaceae bacterium]
HQMQPNKVEGKVELIDFAGNKLTSVITTFSDHPSHSEELKWDQISNQKVGAPIDSTNCLLVFRLTNNNFVTSSLLFFTDPKKLKLPPTKIEYSIIDNQIHLVSSNFAYGVYIDVPDGVDLDDNYFHLLPGEKKVVSFTSGIPIETLKKQIRIKSLVDTY